MLKGVTKIEQKKKSQTAQNINQLSTNKQYNIYNTTNAKNTTKINY